MSANPPPNRPIPDLTEIRKKRQGVRQHPIILDSTLQQEKAVDVRANGIAGDNYYFRTDNPPYNHRAPGAIEELFVREGILKKLLIVNKRVGELGFELYLFDAYRPLAVQNYFHDVWVPTYLRAQHADWSDKKITEETGNYWAKGAPNGNEVDPLSPPPHMTGGVVDITLRSLKTGELLNMGGEFDDVSEISHTDFFEHTGTSSIGRDNRRILYNVMSEAGFMNNPNEWWHYSFGDQMWAKLGDKPTALYSVMKIT